MLRRLILALLTGTIAHLALQVFPYFPVWWIVCFTLILVALAYLRIEIGFLLLFAAFSLSLAYHSKELFCLLLPLMLLLRLLTGSFARTPEMVLLILIAPLLTALPEWGLLPLEVLIVFIAPLLLRGGAIPLASGLACLWCSIVGIIAQQSLMGNLIIGPRLYTFFRLRKLTTPYYDLSWLISGWSAKVFENIWDTVLQITTYFFAHPFLLLQILLWPGISQLLVSGYAWRIKKSQPWLGAAASLIAATILITIPTGIAFLYGKLALFPAISYTATVLTAAVLFAVYREWDIRRQHKSFFANAKPTDAFVQNLLHREQERREAMSLAESVTMQNELQKYIQKKFVKEITALDLDVAGSAQLKLDTNPADVTAAFTGFWKFADLIMLSKGARLLNRAGDGAIYLFGDPNKAMVAAKEFLRNLDGQFNAKKNTLKAPFRVRMGLHHGVMMADPSHAGGDVFSQVLDIAGHLQKAAATGEILISEPVYEKLVYKDDLEAKGIFEKDAIAYYAFRQK